MQEQSRYAIGVDIGTTMVRCVVGNIDQSTGVPTIVGIGEAPNTGMRKGGVANLNGPAQAIDAALGEAERMSGHEVNEATVSINGSHIMSTTADGMIAVGSADHEITHDDIDRVEEVATMGKIPANREIVDVVPHSFRLDGQDNIKDPIGMTGTRLEIHANIVSALAPYVTNIKKAADMATVQANETVPSVLAASRAVLSEKQIESGVAVIDMGGATTGVAVFEEGDLQYVGVVPMGGMNITNDLAIGLKTNVEIAETVKIKHAQAVSRTENNEVTLKEGSEKLTFATEMIDEIVGARLEEIFELVQAELKKAGRAGKLPSGVVLVGGGSTMAGMVEFVKRELDLAATIGRPTGFGGVEDRVEKPAFAAAVGLMFLDIEASGGGSYSKNNKSSSQSSGVANGIKNVFNKLTKRSRK